MCQTAVDLLAHLVTSEGLLVFPSSLPPPFPTLLDGRPDLRAPQQQQKLKVTVPVLLLQAGQSWTDKARQGVVSSLNYTQQGLEWTKNKVGGPSGTTAASGTSTGQNPAATGNSGYNSNVGGQTNTGYGSNTSGPGATGYGNTGYGNSGAPGSTGYGGQGGPGSTGYGSQSAPGSAGYGNQGAAGNAGYGNASTPGVPSGSQYFPPGATGSQYPDVKH